MQGASGIVPAQHRWPARPGRLVAPEEYSSRMRPTDECVLQNASCSSHCASAV